MNHAVNWETISAIGQLVGASAVVISLIYLARQVRSTARATFSSVVIKIIDILQDEKIRRARRTVLATLRYKDLQDWNDIEIEQAEKVCQSYNNAARLLRFTKCPTDPIVEPAKDSILKTWAIHRPLVLSYRTGRGADYWSDYEWLVRKASERSPNQRDAANAGRRDD